MNLTASAEIKKKHVKIVNLTFSMTTCRGLGVQLL